MNRLELARVRARVTLVAPARPSMRYLVFLMLFLIVASLVSALLFVMRDRGNSKRAVAALALRVGLSMGLFLLLMAGYYFGFIPGRLTG